MRLETLRDPLARRVAASDLKQTDADTILKAHEQIDVIFASAEARATARAGSRRRPAPPT
jgi:hypothetical protein